MASIIFLVLILTLILLASPAVAKRIQETPRTEQHHTIIKTISFLIVLMAVYALFSTSVAGHWLLGLLLISAIIFIFLPREKSNNKNTDQSTLTEQINRLLPQTQCGQCNFPGCKPYAAAIAEGKADINQCPPGGEEGIKALAQLLKRDVKPLNPAHGVTKPSMVAMIREPECIGCTKCIQACPVDAIIGASKLMHTIIADLCTGCELCIPPCPMDCIDLILIEQNTQQHQKGCFES